jgi:SAM-dependent methyltransferase
VSEPVQALFDAKAATWAAKYAPGGALAGRRSWLAAAVRARAGPGGRVLDLGCGSGDLARHLTDLGLRVTGCDISERMLEQAERADPAGAWVTLDPAWRELPFPAGAFGAVVASSVLEYVRDPEAVLRECGRVLAPGGSVLVTVPDIRHPVRWLEWLAARGAPLLLPLLELRAARMLQPLLSAGPLLLLLPPGRMARVRAYAEYLRVSRQRHGARWWRAAGRRAGLAPGGSSAGSSTSPMAGSSAESSAESSAAGRSPLRLVSFRKPVPPAAAGP